MVEDITSLNSRYTQPTVEVQFSCDETGGEVFCMSNYQRDVLRMMSMMQSSHMLTDVILEVGTEYFSSHKLLLAAASPYFKAMFTGNLRESLEKDSRIRLHGICPTAMSKVLHFMYSGQIKISEHTVCQLMAASSMLQIVDVLKACCLFLERQLAPTNAIGIAKFAEQHGCLELKAKAQHYILDHFTDVSLEEEFLQLSEVELIEFTRKDELNVKDEQDVYQAVKRWVEHDKEARHHLLTRLLKAVRCQYLSPTFLEEQVRNCNLISNLPACREYLANIFKDLTLHKKVIGRERVGVGGRVLYIAGGFQRHSLDTVESYSPQTDSWTTLAHLTVPRSGLGSAFIKGVLYAIGGRNNSVPGSSYDSDWVDRYDPSRDLWRPCNPMSCPRHRVGVAVLDGHIYACGGSAGTSYLNSVERYDPEEDAWTPVAPMHTSRIGSGCVVVNRMLYTTGGFDGENRLCSCECYHPESNEWSQLPDMAEPRSGHGIAAHNQYIYVFGGYDGRTQLSSVERLNVDTQEWSYVSPMREPRSAVSASVLGNLIYVTGGFGQQGYVSIVEIYDPETDQWKMGAPLSFPRSGHTTCVSHYTHTTVSTVND